VKAATSENALAARRKYTQYCAVTILQAEVLVVYHEHSGKNATKISREKGLPKVITRMKHCRVIAITAGSRVSRERICGL